MKKQVRFFTLPELLIVAVVFCCLAALVHPAMDAARWNITASETQLSLTALGAPLRAGTYRLILTWTENETTLYSLQTEFYVRSENL